MHNREIDKYSINAIAIIIAKETTNHSHSYICQFLLQMKRTGAITARAMVNAG
jgi:hypothetical protein